MFKKVLFCVLSLVLLSPLNFVVAEEESTQLTSDYQYFALDPDIITNYIKPGKRLGYIRVGIDLMVKSTKAFQEVELHEPLIRDRIITVLGEQNEQQIRSISERKAIRLRCLNEINDAIFEITGDRPVEDLLFTKYLDQ
ncbi:flagellar basal body-associated FliL family protein [Psychromonas sp. 14N.309.X.WAT.B.A12]|uniref:flagellar basal body-associated FliL family protein n=1 Tax=unclassified Psychromonas TaxID=2614957 RepID=UPI0025B00C63|nr:flagellar basal body-associated FliL family protein [Psychromonas sp. 14N.309.X.WAT.B.A12]MDN2664016.1 flagellar basal body-associated FliL family protein [Psychromonas sp. 14N.309.X.WAT.B.A12]